MSAAQDLLTAARARGMRLLLDYVVNHVSSEHPRFRAAYDFLLLRESAGEKTGKQIQPPKRYVWDWYADNTYAEVAGSDPRGPKTGSYRVMRGGAWFSYGKWAQVTTRQNHDPNFRQNSVGFRVARNY